MKIDMLHQPTESDFVSNNKQKYLLKINVGWNAKYHIWDTYQMISNYTRRIVGIIDKLQYFLQFLVYTEYSSMAFFGKT